MQTLTDVKSNKAVKETDLGLVFTPDEIGRLRALPPLPKELEERMRLIANLMIDRILKDRNKIVLKAK